MESDTIACHKLMKVSYHDEKEILNLPVFLLLEKTHGKICLVSEVTVFLIFNYHSFPQKIFTHPVCDHKTLLDFKIVDQSQYTALPF